MGLFFNNERCAGSKRALTILYISKIFCAAFIFCLIIPLFAHAESGSDPEPEILSKYQMAAQLAEELHLDEADPHAVLNKLRNASIAISNKDFSTADSLLSEALIDLEESKHRDPIRQSIMFKLQWIQLYLDIFQKYAILALLAFVFLKIPLVYNQIRHHKLTITARICLPLLFSASALTLSIYDLRRYGMSTVMFMDYQVIFVALSGMIGGIWTGLFCGLITGFFRWIFEPDFMNSVGLLVITGTTSSVVRFFKGRPAPLKIVSLVGLLIGYYHASVTYGSLTQLPTGDTLLGILFLGLLEAVAITLFVAVIDSILREEDRVQTSAELIKTQLLFLQAQINPHFFYNAINTIAGVCEEGNSSKGIQLLYNLSDFFRRTTRRIDDVTTLKEETEYLNAYLEIEKARLRERLSVEYDYNIPENLWSVKMPILIVQPIVENAVKHGIAKRPGGGKLTLRLINSGEDIIFEIQDDGPGMKKETVEATLTGKMRESRPSGIGIYNIQQRLLRTWGNKYGLKFESKPGRGTCVSVRIPIHPKKERDSYRFRLAA